MKRFYKICFVALLVPSLAFCETTGFLGGRVVDKKTGYAVKEAKITVASLNRQATTDGDGFFLIGEVPTGTYEISCSAVGCSELTKQVTVRPNVALSEEMSMLRSSSSNKGPELNSSPPTVFESAPPDTIEKEATASQPVAPVENYSPATSAPSFYEPYDPYEPYAPIGSFYGPNAKDLKNGQRDGVRRPTGDNRDPKNRKGSM